MKSAVTKIADTIGVASEKLEEAFAELHEVQALLASAMEKAADVVDAAVEAQSEVCSVQETVGALIEKLGVVQTVVDAALLAAEKAEANE